MKKDAYWESAVQAELSGNKAQVNLLSKGAKKRVKAEARIRKIPRKG